MQLTTAELIQLLAEHADGAREQVKLLQGIDRLKRELDRSQNRESITALEVVEIKKRSAAHVATIDMHKGIIASMSTATTKLHADQRRLEWLMNYITVYGTSGVRDIPWSVLQSEEGEIESLLLDRAAIDYAMAAESKA